MIYYVHKYKPHGIVLYDIYEHIFCDDNWPIIIDTYLIYINEKPKYRSGLTLEELNNLVKL